MRILFLCTELAGYFANSIRALRDLYDVDVMVVSRPNTEPAPFRASLGGIRHVNRGALDDSALMSMLRDFKPDILYVAGWSDKGYLRLAREAREHDCIVVCGLDNPWTGSLRQRAACAFRNRLIHPFFTHLWVAGPAQYEYARRLRYSKDNILMGLYAADVDAFARLRNRSRGRQLVFAGRLEAIKGVDLLYNAFDSLTEAERNGWTLLLVGNGYMKNALKPTTNIAVQEFLQPEEMISRLASAGAFILPSLHEPWGVVVHEFAAAGLPLLLSDAVHSGVQFLIPGYNGLRFAAGSEDAIRSVLVRFFALSPATHEEMGRRSAMLADSGHPRFWGARLLGAAERR